MKELYKEIFMEDDAPSASASSRGSAGIGAGTTNLPSGRVVRERKRERKIEREKESQKENVFVCMCVCAQARVC